jgi:hypothetical protein
VARRFWHLDGRQRQTGVKSKKWDEKTKKIGEKMKSGLPDFPSYYISIWY